MARSSFGLPLINDMNLQGRVMRGTTWEHVTRVQYEVEDVCTFNGTWYQCILQSDASVNADRIPTNTTYWKPINRGDNVKRKAFTTKDRSQIIWSFTDFDESFIKLIQNSGVEEQYTGFDRINILKSTDNTTEVRVFGSQLYLYYDSDVSYTLPEFLAFIANLMPITGQVVNDFSTPPTTTTIEALGVWVSSGSELIFTPDSSGSLSTAIITDEADFSMEVFPPRALAVAGQTFSEGDEGIYKNNLYIATADLDTVGLRSEVPGFGPNWTSIRDLTESIVGWLKNSGSKVFNFVGGELSSFTITATDDSIWTQALNFTAGNLTSITYTHDSGNSFTWSGTVITKTFNYTNGELSSIDYDRS